MKREPLERLGPRVKQALLALQEPRVRLGLPVKREQPVRLGPLGLRVKPVLPDLQERQVLRVQLV